MSRPLVCHYERFKTTAAPIASRQRSLLLCQCLRCTAARASHAIAKTNALFKPAKAEIAERLAVLRWRPEPEPEPEDAA